MDATTLIAVYAAVVSTIVLVIQFAEFGRNRDSLKLSISTGIPVGGAEALTGTNHIVEVSVASSGGRPVGVSSLALRLTDGRTVPLINHLPTNGSRPLPAVLERGQFADYWLRHDLLEQQLRAEGVRIDSVVANLTDGRKVARRVPADWRRLGD